MAHLPPHAIVANTPAGAVNSRLCRGLQAWEREGYHFESGPSLYSGMASRGKDGNPLAHVLQVCLYSRTPFRFRPLTYNLERRVT